MIIIINSPQLFTFLNNNRGRQTDVHKKRSFFLKAILNTYNVIFKTKKKRLYE